MNRYPIITEPALNICSLAEYRYHPELEKRFWFESKYEDGTPINLSKREGNRLWVPRNCATIGPDTEIGWTDGAKLSSPIRLVKGARPRDAVQERILFESGTWLDRGQSHIIEASTAIGKTFIGCALAAWCNVPTLVVVPKSDLFGDDQWGGALKQFLGLKPHEWGIIRQGKCQVEGRKVVLGLVHSLATDKYPDWIKDYFGLVIFDEVHRMAAETFNEVSGMYNARLRLGLTADTHRPDGKTFVFLSHIGEVLVEAKQIALRPRVLVVPSPFQLPRVKRKVKVNGQWEWRIMPMPHKPGKMMHIMKMMTKTQARNSLILDFIMEAYGTGRNVLLLSDLARDLYLNALAEMLVVRGIPKAEIGFYVSGMKQKELDDHKRRRVVLGTYGMCSTATNVPEWDTLVMATPRSNVKQPIGRVVREFHGKKEPVILDIVDQDSWVCMRYSQNRLEVYTSEEINAEVEVLG